MSRGDSPARRPLRINGGSLVAQQLVLSLFSQTNLFTKSQRFPTAKGSVAVRTFMLLIVKGRYAEWDATAAEPESKNAAKQTD